MRAVIILLVLVTAVVAQIIITERIHLTTRDNISLFTHIDRQNVAIPLPSILERTPYSCPDIIHPLVLTGRVYICQEIRGTFRSNGTYSFFDTEWRDTDDLVKYITAQKWSDKTIRSFGMSAPAIAAYMEGISPLARQHLKGQCLYVGTSDIHRFTFPNGAFLGAVEAWLKAMKQERIIPMIKATEPYTQVWYNRSVLKTESYKDIHFPTIHFGGWYDLFVDETIAAFEAYRSVNPNTTWLIIGGLCAHCTKAEISFPNSDKYLGFDTCMPILLDAKIPLKPITFYIMTSPGTEKRKFFP